MTLNLYPHLTVTIAGGTATLTSPYDVDLIAEAKTLGGRWNASVKSWRIAITDVNRAAVADLGTRAASVTDPDHTLTPVAAFALPDVSSVDVPGTEAATLRSHQAAVVAAVQNGARRILLADEPGLGKTASALISVAAVGAYPAVVVCPSVVKINWQREADRWTPGKRVVVLAGRKADPAAAQNADIVIINYDILDAWVPTLVGLRPRSVVLDEAHYAKDQRSKRGAAALTLCTVVPADGVVMALTGTPVPNRVIDLAGPLGALGWLDQLGGFWGFARRYCAAHQADFGWDMSGADNLPELHTRLQALGLVRRVKADVADLPARTVVDLPVALKTDGARSVRQAQKALTDLLVARVKASAAGSDGKKRAVTKTLIRQIVTAALADNASGAGAALMTLRRVLGDAKAPLVIDQARQIAEDAGKVVVFVHHRDVQDAVAAGLADLGVVRIAGGQDANVRQAAVDAFQADPTVRVCVASIQAAGVGLTLHAASNVVLGELPWTAAAQDQAIDRVHRIGQSDAVTAWRVLAEGTLDARLAELIAGKAAVANAVVDGADYDQAAGDAGKAARIRVLTDLVAEALKVADEVEVEVLKAA